MSWLSGSILDHSGNAGLTSGGSNCTRASRGVQPAPWTNSPFEVVPQLPQSIGDGPPQVTS